MEAQTTKEVTVIEPPEGWRFPDWRDLWDNRDLLYFLGRREVVIRYKQAAAGAFWAVLQPLLLAGLFAVFLGIFAQIESPDIPYALLAVTGLVFWIPFSRAIEFCTSSTVAYESLITKIYLPRITIPVASIAAPAFDMVIGTAIGIAIAAGWGYFPTFKILIVPFLLVLALLLALGMGMIFSALNVRYRDLTLAVPTLMLVGLFITPITYPYSAVLLQAPDWVEPFYALNPMVGILEGFRWAILGTEWPGAFLMTVPVVEAAILLVLGSLYYERKQATFADII